jgi:hypothetical protein
MKQLVFLMMILASEVYSYGQNFEFADSNAVWSVSDKKYFINGDSLYNALNYKKIFIEYDSVIATGSYFALLREDITENKVYVIYKDSTNENLLYDFSLVEGDETTVFPFDDYVYRGPVTVTVDSIDSVYIYDAYRKRITISGVNEDIGFDEKWVEGIGSSTFGLFGSGLNGVMVLDAYYPFLLCYEEDSVMLFDNPNFSTCYYQYANLSEYSESIKFRIFPNPATKYIVVESELKQAQYKLLSSEGKMIKQGVLDQFQEISISEIPEGLYVFLLISKKGIGFKKFVKI